MRTATPVQIKMSICPSGVRQMQIQQLVSQWSGDLVRTNSFHQQLVLGKSSLLDHPMEKTQSNWNRIKAT